MRHVSGTAVLSRPHITWFASPSLERWQRPTGSLAHLKRIRCIKDHRHSLARHAFEQSVYQVTREPLGVLLLLCFPLQSAIKRVQLVQTEVSGRNELFREMPPPLFLPKSVQTKPTLSKSRERAEAGVAAEAWRMVSWLTVFDALRLRRTDADARKKR